MSNKRILYNLDLSPPVRAVRAVAKLLGIDLELRNVDVRGGEQFSEFFLKMNPEHTVPVLDDQGFIIWDSQAICSYLVDKYAKDDKLYPKDLQLRAKCNQRLFFNSSSLFVRILDIVIPILNKGCTEIPQEKLELIASALQILETFLANDPFLVGQQLTIADICLSLTVPFLGIYVPITADKYPKIIGWLNRINKEIPWFEEMNGKYTEQHRQLIYGVIEKNKQNK